MLRFTEVSKLIRDDSIPKVGSELQAAILAKVLSNTKTLQHFASRTGYGRIVYPRKLSWFVQILDFVPSIIGAQGQPREPSELKEIIVLTKQLSSGFLCTLNSTLFYWLLTLWSDCRNLNKREVLGVPLDFHILKPSTCQRLAELAGELMESLRKNSSTLEMHYAEWGRMKIQCIYPKFSKPIIDEIDHLLAQHYGFTEEELDFIINYDIKYRMGRDADSEDE